MFHEAPWKSKTALNLNLVFISSAKDILCSHKLQAIFQA